MATRSTIAVELANGTVHQVYCHWDGYVSHNGTLLNNHYNTQEQVEKLVSFGDMSCLGECIEPTTDAHSFETREEGVTVYYGRDRDETDERIKTKVFESYDSYKTKFNREEYNYIFRNGKWFVAAAESRNEFVELETLISNS